MAKFEKGKLMDDREVIGSDGDVRRLWDFRNRSHVAIVVSPDEEARGHLAKAAEMKKTWDWLGLTFVRAVPSGDLPRGLYAVDKFGVFIAALDFSDSVWENLEKEIIYFEAKHC